jgi:hypothetical protein
MNVQAMMSMHRQERRKRVAYIVSIGHGSFLKKTIPMILSTGRKGIIRRSSESVPLKRRIPRGGDKRNPRRSMQRIDARNTYQESLTLRRVGKNRNPQKAVANSSPATLGDVKKPNEKKAQFL